MKVFRSPDINFVHVVSVDNMMRLVSSIGIEQLLKELAVLVCLPGLIKRKLEQYPCFVSLDTLADHDDLRDLFGMPVHSEEAAQ